MSEVIPTGGLELSSHPRLKLFLSADIVGSTAFKQPFNLDRDEPLKWSRWSEKIQSFYSKFALVFKRQWIHMHRELAECEEVNYDRMRLHWLGDHQPRLWKTVGDEVIFWKTITDDIQIWTMLACWYRVLPLIREELGAPLDIKCTAWSAGFPVRNKAVWMDSKSVKSLSKQPKQQIPDVDESVEVYDGDYGKTSVQILEQINKFYADEEYTGEVDFIGPGIDVGFRISQWATARKFSISLDVAYLIALTADKVSSIPMPLRKKWFSKTPTVENPLEIFFDGSEFLKGVLGGLNYPRFFLLVENNNTLEFYEDKLE